MIRTVVGWSVLVAVAAAGGFIDDPDVEDLCSAALTGSGSCGFIDDSGLRDLCYQVR